MSEIRSDTAWGDNPYIIVFIVTFQHISTAKFITTCSGLQVCIGFGTINLFKSSSNSLSSILTSQLFIKELCPKSCCFSSLFGGNNLPQSNNSLGKLNNINKKIAKNDQKCKQLIITNRDEEKRKVEIKPSLRDQIEANALFPRGELTSHDKQAHLCFYPL